MSTENDDQKAFWEGFAELWVTKQTDLDALMAPVLQGVLDRAALQPGDQVLDIGCGTGTSTINAAHAVAPDGHVLGADISAPMLKRAQQVAADVDNASFETTDVAHHAFEPGTFNQVISRFGVMFFVSPEAAFQNIIKAMRPGAQLTMACWSALDRNPWFQVPMYAAKRHLGAPPSVDPDAPGPLAFRDIGRVTKILEVAGFEAIEGNAEQILLTPLGSLADVASHAASIGPAARTVEYFEAGKDDFDVIARSVAEDFQGYMTPNGALVPAEINFFTARAPEH